MGEERKVSGRIKTGEVSRGGGREKDLRRRITGKTLEKVVLSRGNWDGNTHDRGRKTRMSPTEKRNSLSTEKGRKW